MIITYERTYFGHLCHVGWYADGYIITYLEGQKEGKQIIVYRDEVVGISYRDSDNPSDEMKNSYEWGRVFTEYHRQDVYLENADLWPPAPITYNGLTE